MRNTDATILMCPPKYFVAPGPNQNGAHANGFEKNGYQKYLNDPDHYHGELMRQWDAVAAEIDKRANLILFDPPKDIPEQVFTADSSFSVKNTSILGKFSNAQRQPEQDLQRTYLKTQPSRTLIDIDHFSEGNGDCVYDPWRNIIYSGYTPDAGLHKINKGRSDINANKLIQKHLNIPVISLQTHGEFYHIDTVLAPLSRGHMVINPLGISERAWGGLEYWTNTYFGHRAEDSWILTSEEDGNALAANIRCIDDTVLIPKCSAALKRAIRKKGYEVIELDVDKLIGAGGAIHCITNPINETAHPDGIYNQRQVPCAPGTIDLQ